MNLLPGITVWGLVLVCTVLWVRLYRRKKRQCCHRAVHTSLTCDWCGGGLCEYHHRQYESSNRTRPKADLCPRCWRIINPGALS